MNTLKLRYVNSKKLKTTINYWIFLSKILSLKYSSIQIPRNNITQTIITEI